MPDIVQTCRLTGKKFLVSIWEQDFLRKMGVPLPTLCIEERHKRRLAHRNERKIYNDTCDLSGKAIISLYSPDKSYKVYSQEAWHSDQWDARVYGRDFDFSRPFFEQFFELQQVVPHLALINARGENSDYCNVTNGNKNCYLVFGGDYCEDCMYSVFSMYCKDTADVYWVNKSELMYDCIDCGGCYNLRYSQNSTGCRDSAFLFECKNCEDCFGCVGMINKKFHIFNKAYSVEEYKKKVQTYRLDTWTGVQHMKEQFKKFILNFPHRNVHILNSENVSGDFITNAKNCENCYDIEGPAEDCKDVFLGGYNAKDMVSSDHAGFKAELYYEMLGSIEGNSCAFCTFSWTSQNTYYCDMVINSHDLFGCSNMKRAEYCILNKQYSKEEYFILREKIVEHMKKTGEWGEFFPIENSLYAYNETVAQDFFPLTQEQAKNKGLKWLVEEGKIEKGAAIPDAIHDVSDELVGQVLRCELTGKPYRIIPQELKLYKKLGVPVPHFAPEARNALRIAQRNSFISWTRNCSKCQKEIQTTYSPHRPEIVYCEDCYLAQRY